MYAGLDFSVADQVESEVYAFDFVNDLADGDSIVSATWFCSVAPNSPISDPTPSARLINAPFIASRTVTTQRVAGLLTGVTYVLKCNVITATGNTTSLFSHVSSGLTV